MATITFDGPGKIIDIGYDAPTTTVTALDIYSRWKDWVLAGNAQYAEAFDLSVGGNDLGGGAALDGYLFLRNDLGWRIRPADQDHVLVITGQLFGYSTGQPKYLSRATRTIVIQEVQSSRAQVVQGGDPASIAAEVWTTSKLTGTDGTMGFALRVMEAVLRNRVVTNPALGTYTVYDDNNNPLLYGLLWEDAAGTTPYSGAGAERRDRLA